MTHETNSDVRKRRLVNPPKTIELIIEEENVHEYNNQIVPDGDVTVRPSACRTTHECDITFRSAHPFIITFPNRHTPFRDSIIDTTQTNNGKGPFERTECVVVTPKQKVYYSYKVELIHRYTKQKF